MDSSLELYPHQEIALDKLHTGAILSGGVGSGKSFTGLSYYVRDFSSRPLYIITTAIKRDKGDWQADAELMNLTDVVVDSWNNIKKYLKIKNAFFIFDEQRVVGYNAWGKSFIQIAKNNKWIMLSATPGDTWMDYIPVFIANGFYRNKTDFVDQHVEYDPYVKYPKVKKYHNEGKLLKLRHSILVPMPMKRHTTRVVKNYTVGYDEEEYKSIFKDRWNIFTDEPIQNASELTHALRRVVALDEDRIAKARWIIDVHDKIIVFYNYNHELDILIDICNALGKTWSEWNGRSHQPIPNTESWVYLVQYTAGAEGWNCVETDVMMFYSLNYSYRVMEQAQGRIDRLNTPFTKLEYFALVSESPIDKSVQKAIDKKETFNATAWTKRSGIIF